MNNDYDNLYGQNRQYSNKSLKGKAGSAMKTVGNTQRVAGGAATAAGAATRAAGKGTELAGKGVQKASNTLGNAASKIPVVGGALGAGIKGAGNAAGSAGQKAGQLGQNAGQKLGTAGKNLRNSGNNLRNKGNQLSQEGNSLNKAANGLRKSGKAAKTLGKTTKVAGKGAELAGKGVKAAGKGIKTASNAIGTAASAIPVVGTAIGAGIKAAGNVAGTAAQAAGKAGELAGKAGKAAGKAVEKVGKGAEKVGEASGKATSGSESVGGKIKGLAKLAVPIGAFVLLNLPLMLLLMVLVGGMLDENESSGSSSSVSAAGVYTTPNAGNISEEILGYLQKPVNIEGDVTFTGQDAFGANNGLVQNGVILTHTNSGINVGDNVFAIYDGKIVGKGTANGEVSGNSAGMSGYVYPKYSLTEDQLKNIASQCDAEQGSSGIAAVKAEASLMGNLYELYGADYDGIYRYVLKSGWFANSERHMDPACADRNNQKCYDRNGNFKGYAYTQEEVDAVRDVLVNGNRTIPPYIDEHDCWDCIDDSTCPSGRGDICSITTNGKTYTSLSDIKNKNNYIPGNTIIKTNHHNATYTFYLFMSESRNADPFGYTENAKKSVDMKVENDNNWLKIEHTINGATFYSVYKHLGSISDGLEVGSTVKKGDVIGKVGTVKGRTEASLFFGIEDAIEVPLNPSNLFTAHSAVAGGGDYIWPVNAIRIEDHFGDRANEIRRHPESYPPGSTEAHFAIDIDTNREKIPFYAVGPGTIESISTRGVYSIELKLDATTANGDPIYVKYSHGDAISGLFVGQHLDRGQQIGTCNGHTGFDVHMHFEVYIKQDGKTVWQNPLLFLYGISFDGKADGSMNCNIIKPDGSSMTKLVFDNYDGEAINFKYVTGTSSGYSDTTKQYMNVQWVMKN